MGAGIWLRVRLPDRTLTLTDASRRCSWLVVLVAVCSSVAAAAQELPGTGQDPDTAEAASNESIAVHGDEAGDIAIQARLEELYEEVGGLDGINIAVQHGVVTLTGVVPERRHEETAEQLASRVDGVVTVVNSIEFDRSLRSRLEAAFERVSDSAAALLAMLPVLAVATLIILLFWFSGRYIAGREAIFERASSSLFVRGLLQQLARIVFVLAGLFLALEILDAGALLGSIVGALGIVGLAVGFATRDTVENYIASILLSLRQPFAYKDHVLIGDQEGKVIRLTPRATILMSLDGNHIRIPNATVFKSTIVNYTRNPLRRFTFEVGVDTELDLVEPRRLAIESVGEVPGVLEDPEPTCLVTRLGDSNVVLTISGWVDQREADFLLVESEALRTVKDSFDSAGIVMPEPIYNVKLHRSGTSERKPPPVRPAPGSATRLEVRPETTIDEQIDADAQRDTQPNLLDDEALRE